jgi:PAS domain S-box-containing protein
VLDSIVRPRVLLVVAVALVAGLVPMALPRGLIAAVSGAALAAIVAWIGSERLCLRPLRRAHDALDLLARERTAELVATNRALQADVVERQRVEERLQKLSRVIEQTGDSVFITDRDGVIEYVNPSFEKLTGYSRQEAVGATPRLFKSDRHDAEFYANVWRRLAAGETLRTVFTNRAKDGRLYFEDQTVTPLRDSAGHITHFVSTGRDITQRKRAEEALRRMNDSLERETNRIAGILHDEAGQFLTVAHITLAEVARDLPPDARERLQDVRQNLDQIEEQLRRLSHELRPRILTDLGLVAALEFLAEGVTRRAGIPVSVEASLEKRCSPLAETALYRLVQEGLTNMTRHAHASRGSVVLKQDANAVSCVVRDDGVGFDTQDGHGRRGLGLIGIRDRLAAVGGILEVTSAPGAGTALLAKIPMEMSDANSDPAGR